MDADFFSRLETQATAIQERDPQVMTEIIARCCELKAEIVIEDELETSGRRAILNYGHTFGHAIENVFGYGEYLHGEAVAIGMHCAARLAASLDMVNQEFVARQQKCLREFNLPTTIPSGHQAELLAAMYRDKKVSQGTLKVILPTRIGHVELIDAPGEELLAASWAIDSADNDS